MNKKKVPFRASGAWHVGGHPLQVEEVVCGLEDTQPLCIQTDLHFPATLSRNVDHLQELAPWQTFVQGQKLCALAWLKKSNF